MFPFIFFFSSAEERDDKFPHHRVFVMLLVSNGWHFFFENWFQSTSSSHYGKTNSFNINGGGVSFSQA